MGKWMLITLIICPLSIFAQQQGMFSQYMFNGLAINPAYAGTHKVLSITALSRFQAVGIEGAPKTQTLSAHTPLTNEKIAVGMLLVHETIGVVNQLSFNGSYAYKIRFDIKKVLSFGLQAGLNSYKAAYSDLLVPNPDPSFEEDVKSLNPNFGFGVFYYTDKFYTGISIPQLGGNIFNGNSNAILTSNPIILTGGYIMSINSAIKFKPNALFKFIQNRPVEFDLNANFSYDDVLWVGVSLKTVSSVNLLTELQMTNQLRFGYSYGITSNSLRVADQGSHELMLNYKFRYPRDGVFIPRHF